MPLSHSRSSLVIIFIATILTAAHSQQTNTTTSSYANCNRTFSCGSIRNITYPFTGGDRPSHCGLPEFTLTCRDNSVTELTKNSVAYRVLQLDQAQKVMILAPSFLYNNPCPSEFHNSTLNSTLFRYDLPENDVVNLFYGCNGSAMSVKPPNLFNCSSSISNFTNSYYLIGPVPTDPILRFIFCSVRIRVPVLKDSGQRLTGSSISLGEALMRGFSVNYNDSYQSICSKCNGSGGQCGFDWISGQPVCICDEKLCPSSLAPQPAPPPEANRNAWPSSQGNDDRNKPRMNVVPSIAGAILAGIGLGWLIFYCRQRRKLRLATNSARTISKDIIIPPSSKGLSSRPLTTFTPSIPSYPSPKTDLSWDSSDFGVQIFSYCDLEEATDNFDHSRELGDGGFGTVYYGTLRDGSVVAVKRLYENNFKRVEQFRNEVEILTRLRHQNLVTLYGCTSKSSRDLVLVYEYIPNGTVADHLHGKWAKSGLLSWPIRLNIAIETADALTYLHKSDIVHRDVKTDNILLDNDFHVKVADFGLSRIFPNDVTHVSTAPQGTPGYVDPEYYQCYKLTEKSDVYSFGVVLIELMSSLQAVDINRHRHDINLSNMAINKIQNRTFHELVDQSLGFERDCTTRRKITLVAELAFRCLQQERDMRPSMEEVLETLRAIQNEKLNAHKVEVVDISIDDEIALLTGSISPPSPVSVCTDK